MMKYKISEYAKMKKVTYRTVWAWVKSGKVQSELTETGRILILDTALQQDTSVCIYCRVSSSENKNNLDTQAERLVSYANAKGYKVERVVKEVGSGLNDQRQKLKALLMDKTAYIILVEHKDRLTRFGFHYIEDLLAMQQRKIEVVNNLDSPKEDLISDFTAIISSFCARIYGLRRSKRKTEQLIAELNEK